MKLLLWPEQNRVWISDGQSKIEITEIASYEIETRHAKQSKLLTVYFGREGKYSRICEQYEEISGKELIND